MIGAALSGARQADERTASGATRGIFIGVVVATCGVYAAVTMAPVVAHDITGSALLAGLPMAALFAGAGVGASGMTVLTGRYGRQRVFTVIYVLGAAACLIAAVAVARASFVLLVLAIAGVGMGHAANQVARYAAAELHPEDRRPAVIGWMVWAQAIGAVVGPLSLSPAARVSPTLGFPVEAGGFLLGVALFAAAAVSHALGPRYRPVREAAPQAVVTDDRSAPLWGLPTVQLAVAALVTCLTVMLLVMTVTPVHVRTTGHGVAGVGAIMSAHTFGMFALAPVAGWLTGRFGSVTVILGGLATLLIATVAGATAPSSSQLVLGAALFLLGFGWCLGFVAASALLTRDLAPAVRLRLQGRVEGLTWITGAAAAVGSGLLLGLVGYGGLNLIAAALLVVPLAVVVMHRAGLAQFPNVAG